jgi:hypothetical protein
MILTEERTSTIKFGSEFTHVDYFCDNKVIVVGFKSPREAKLFKEEIINKYASMFEVERSIYAVMLRACDGVTITNVTRDDSLTLLSISLSYACSFAS